MTFGQGMTKAAGTDVEELCAVRQIILEQANTAVESRLARRAPFPASRAEDRMTFEAVDAPLVVPHP